MSEKASVFQTVQIGVEASVGTPVAATLKLAATSIDCGPRLEADAFRPLGVKYPSFVTPNKEWSEFSIDGKLTYNEIVYLLASLLSQPAAAQQDATTAYKWTFTSDTDGEDAGIGLTIERGDANNAWEIPGGRVAGLTFTFNRNECSVSGTGFGEKIDTTANLTAGLSPLEAVPVLPTQLTFKMADTQAGLAGATAMTRGFSLVWELSNKVGLAWPVGQDPIGVELVPNLRARLRIATDATGLGLITNMRAGTTKWFRVSATGAVIAAPHNYSLQLDFPAQILNPSNPSDEEGIDVIEYEMAGVHDAAWGKSFQIDLVNKLTDI
jgi:hypothetical protein